MPKPQWRTFSIKVGPRKSVAVQSRFPLLETEWDALFAALYELRELRVADADAEDAEWLMRRMRSGGELMVGNDDQQR